jgi:hypothetical protein
LIILKPGTDCQTRSDRFGVRFAIGFHGSSLVARAGPITSILFQVITEVLTKSESVPIRESCAGIMEDTGAIHCLQKLLGCGFCAQYSKQCLSIDIGF